MPVHRELPEGQTGVLPQHLVQHSFCRAQRADIPRLRVLTNRIPFFDHEQVAEPCLSEARKTAADELFAVPERAVMLLDEQQNALGVLLREPQARQQRGRKRAALLRVAAEVTDPLLIYGLAGRFSAVVQQHRPPQTEPVRPRERYAPRRRNSDADYPVCSRTSARAQAAPRR